MGDTNFHHDYVPPSKRPKAATPPPEPKENNPWLISPPTPTAKPDRATASPEPGPSQAQGNNPWLISKPSPKVAPEPAVKAATVAPPPAPTLPQSIPGFVYSAFPVCIFPISFHFALQVVPKHFTDTRNFRLSRSILRSDKRRDSSTFQEDQSQSQTIHMSGSGVPLGMLGLLLQFK